MEDNKKHWLNQFGERIWNHKTLPISLTRSYHWVDRVIMIDESKGRKWIGELKFSTLDELSLVDDDGNNYYLEDFIIYDKNYIRNEKLKKIIE